MSILKRILPSLSQSTAIQPNNKASHVAALNGLRGIACLIVFNHHLTWEYDFSMAWSTSRRVLATTSIPVSVHLTSLARGDDGEYRLRHL